MRTVRDIYEAYRIMPNLQLHQLRVGAVGKMVCDSFSGDLDKESALLACLFHDMGNIIKFDMDVFPQFQEPEGKDYWRGVQAEWFAKYGSDEHAASNAVAKEIGLPDSVRTLIDDVRFSRLEAERDSDSFEGKIIKYSDLRVSPFGIRSLTERMAEGRTRYAEKKGYNTPEGSERYERLAAAAHEIEKQIFEHCSIRPEDISDESASALAESLRDHDIPEVL